jgi:hypothetical protein
VRFTSFILASKKATVRVCLGVHTKLLPAESSKVNEWNMMYLFWFIFLACYKFAACVWDENLGQFCLSESCPDGPNKMEYSLFGKILSGFIKHSRCAIR